MQKKLCVGCLDLSPVILSQFTLKMCTSAKNCRNKLSKPLLEVQGRSRSSTLINLKSPSPVIVMMSSMQSFSRYTSQWQ